MQYKTILQILGILLMIFSLTMLTPMIIVRFDPDSFYLPYINSFLITFITGFLLWLPFRKSTKQLKVRDGFLLTVLFWFVLSFFGAIPFMLAPDLKLNFTNAMFESVSGLTTTGSTVLSGLGFLPKAIMYYRQQLQFLGGMGIIVLAVAILPMLGIGGMQLYRAEVPGPIKDSKLTPRITETAKTLWYIYVGLTILCALTYWFAGMTPFDAIGESFGTVSTGGFSMHDSSFAYYHNAFINIFGVVFMILGGTNFSLHFLALKNKRVRVYAEDREFRTYIYLLFTVVIITVITLLYYRYYPSTNQTIINALFDVTSLLTTTGFTAGQFSDWPTFLPYLIMLAALIGGCGGSTSGGIKVMRVLIALKQSTVEIKRLIHPRSVTTLTLGKTVLPEKLTQAVTAFIALFLTLTFLFILLLLSQGLNITTAIGAVIASIANAGAGIGDIAANFQPLNAFSKWVLILAMLAGRLEIFTILVLITPSFWQK